MIEKQMLKINEEFLFTKTKIHRHQNNYLKILSRTFFFVFFILNFFNGKINLEFKFSNKIYMYMYSIDWFLNNVELFIFNAYIVKSHITHMCV